MACVEDRHDIVYSDENPDLLLFSTFNALDHLRYDCHKLLVTGENIDPDFSICDFSVSMRENSERNYYWPLFEPDRVLAMLPESGRSATDPRHAQAKTQFCCFLYRNGKPQERIELCKLLMRRKAVDCPGQVLNNMPLPDRVRQIESRADPREEGRRELYSRYRFTIAFENEREHLYITEKIFTPLTVGSIPIYWGALEITELFNPQCFVNCHDFDSFEAVADHVMAIENDPELYRQYREAPPVLPGSRLYQMTPDAVVEFFDRRVASQIGTSTPVSRTVRSRLRRRVLLAMFHVMPQLMALNKFLKNTMPWLRPALKWAGRGQYKWLREKLFWTWRR